MDSTPPPAEIGLKTSLSRTAKKGNSEPICTLLWDSPFREKSESKTDVALHSVSHFLVTSLYFGRRDKAKCLRIRTFLIVV